MPIRIALYQAPPTGDRGLDRWHRELVLRLNASTELSITTATTGDIIYASATDTLSLLGIGSTFNVLTVSGGIPSWGQVNLASGAAVTGILPSANGGSGTTDFTEAVQDAVGAMVDSTLVYVDATPLLTRAALSGDITASQASNVTTLATVNGNVGSFGSSTSIPSFTVNAKGLITAASGNVVIAPAGTLTGTVLAANVVTSSLTTIGTLVAGAVPASLVTAGTFGTGAYVFDSTVTLSGSGATILTLSGATAGISLTSATGTKTVTSTGALTISATGTVTISNTVTGSLTTNTVGDTITNTPAGSFYIYLNPGAVQYLRNTTVASSGATTRSSPGMVFVANYWSGGGANVNVNCGIAVIASTTDANNYLEFAKWDFGGNSAIELYKTTLRAKFNGPIEAQSTLAVIGVTTLATSLTGILRADAGVVSVAAGVGTKSLFDHFADANNGTTVETDLYSDTIPAARLAANGEKLEAQYSGIYTGDATSTQRVRAYFGGTLIFDSGALAIGLTTPTWECLVTIIRVSSSVVRCAVSYTSSFAALGATATYTEVTGLTLANTQILKITGTAAGATGGSNQITAKESYVQWLPAA